jgi:hypothetical protein
MERRLLVCAPFYGSRRFRQGDGGCLLRLSAQDGGGVKIDDQAYGERFDENYGGAEERVLVEHVVFLSC